MQLKKIKVYGKLRQFLGKSYFMAAVKSPQQAISFLFANYNGLEKHMNDQIYKIKMGGNVVAEEFLSISGQGDIQIIPIAIGSLDNVGEIFIGGLAIAFGGAIPIFGPIITKYGFDLLIGGISDIISPQNPIPNTSSVSDIDPRIRGSYSFSGIQNVSRSGVCIPLIYGEVFCGSIVVSSGTDTAPVFRE